MIITKRTCLLDALNDQFSIIQSSALVTMTGLMLENTFNRNIKKDELAAISSGLLNQAVKTLKLLHCGDLAQVEMLCADGILIITQVFNGAILVILIDPELRPQLDIKAAIEFVLRNHCEDAVDPAYESANNDIYEYGLCVN